MLEMSSIDKEEVEIKFSSKEVRRFNRLVDKAMKNSILIGNKNIVDYYNKLKIKLDEEGEIKFSIKED